MGIERHGDVFAPTCDCCGAELIPAYDFHEAVEIKQAAGWRSIKEGSDWLDLCPECYKTLIGAAADFSEE